EPERFSPDKDWMPRIILLAKSTYVWLDQLSKKYQREISRLDQIPDEELEQLARWGFTGLWLIGLWERSRASRTIKQMCGNPDAVASAYSLFDYEIAHDLGGEEAFQNLRQRAWQRGIRLCGDMVPNHMGIDSRWVMEHPEWFLSLDHSPFPSYSYNGPNLSWDQRVGIYLEDHYYSKSDAAVTFKRVDFQTGDTKYIYHGNDGTSMPWNDTAQLNYLNPQAREAVIQTILAVARKFSVIRFDAAMTLTRKHFQRLWFPEPGSGGDIPSRAEHGMTRAEFNRHMPEEFWREVVNRIAQEVPDTLLLAEAFWLMEGYFVRTLGMHRVYNSAFMNMLKKEENAKYRTSIKNVLEFNPEILKRFVNFMNNPDEDTAVAQFGKDDKYFGVCLMMVTMPGLPMFGHGQIEGFTEKYGMEYKRAYWNEQPDEHLIQRHEREIFPLMHKRYIFTNVDNFLLYDFFTPEGWVNENVFAYSNRYGEERGLVVYNNKFEPARGWVKTSVAFVQKGVDGLVQMNLGEGLGLQADENSFVIFREHISGLEFIRHSNEFFERGLYVELDAFKYQVFLDFQEAQDNQWHHYAQLNSYLNGRGVPSVDEALQELILQPIHQQFAKLVDGDFLQKLIAAGKATEAPRVTEKLLDEFEQKSVPVLAEIKRFHSGKGDAHRIA
ncbi:MAG TPA: alpha-amylase, partial [Caldithrix sp.]|nr:alpha-amylase [Caldithrix sp.]